MSEAKYIKKGKRYIAIPEKTEQTTDERILLNCAFRYALGRQTYVVGVIVEKLIHDYPLINIHDRKRIAEEIEEAIRDNNAGHDMDVREWKRVSHLFRDENHCRVKAFFAAEARIEDSDKEYPPIKVSDKYEIREAVRMDGRYYATDMKAYFHTVEVLPDESSRPGYRWVKKLGDAHYAGRNTTLCGKPMLGNNYNYERPDAPICVKCQEIKDKGE